MSMNLDNGTCLTGSPFAALESFRAPAQDLFERAYVAQAALRATQSVDLYQRGLLPTDRLTELAGLWSPIVSAQRHLQDKHRRVRTEGVRSSEADFECELSFLATPDPERFLVLVYAENAGYHKLWQTMPGVESYSWNNYSDTLPEGVTQNQYDLRGRAWKAALKDDTPARRGLSWSVVGRDVFVPRERLLELLPECLPTPRQRARMILDASISVPWVPSQGLSALLERHNELVAEQMGDTIASLSELDLDVLFDLPR